MVEQNIAFARRASPHFAILNGGSGAVYAMANLQTR